MGKVVLGGLAAALLATACMAPRLADPTAQLGVGEPLEQGPPPPNHIAVEIHAVTGGAGFVYRQGYFTEAEVLDPRWEVRRREKMNQIRMCPSYRIVRRDIRWYEATPESGQRCAAIVYSGLCAGRRGSGRDERETDRITVLRQDADRPIPAACGTKDPALTPERPRPSDEQRRAELLSPAATCEAGEAATAEPIRLVPATRVHVRTLVHPGFAAASPEPFRADWFARIPTNAVSAFSREGRIVPQIRTSPLPDDGVNLLVTLEFALRRDGEPYCVQLSARQGARRWRRTIERPGFVEHLRREVAIDRHGRSNDPARYWSPAPDAILLANALGAYLLAHAAPDREFRRGWRR